VELDFHSNALATPTTTTTTTTTTRWTLTRSKDSVMNLTDTRSCEWYTVEGYKVIGPCFAQACLKHLLHLLVWHVVRAVLDAAEEVVDTRRENVGVWRRGLESYGLEQRERGK
jgi:hypothetical protein